MDGMVDGLDVVDFPGVDDKDETISGLAELLLSITQVVIFVVEYKYVSRTSVGPMPFCLLYRRAHTTSAEKWLKVLQSKSVPVLVCLTHADKLFAQFMDNEESEIRKRIEEEKKVSFFFVF